MADAEFNVKKYVDAVSKTTMTKLNETDRVKTIAAIQDLYNVIQYDLFMVDLPLQVSMDLDLKKAINFCKVHFDTAVLNDPYGIIESVIKVHQECELGSYIALTNVAHYLDTRSFADLTSLVNETGLSLVLIEFTELKAKVFYKNCEFTFIDQDFVDWQP
ncbi:type II-A CRISPR-associated protein Csn2 [Agrilactobacillus fermenti]|uniref:type II-A CRISPR-associated protein Csn2 n=1 Tax=Agrilactobacillus fermenti TaxID=2586909 RepID=UPI003A5BC969